MAANFQQSLYVELLVGSELVMGKGSKSADCLIRKTERVTDLLHC